MNPVHPYLNPQENPANALNRLLQLLPASPGDFGFDEVQLCEAICFQARRTHHIVCASQTTLQTLLPAPNLPPESRHANLFNVNVLLQTEADITHAMGEIYAVMVENFFGLNPHLPRYPSLMPAPLAPDHASANMPGPWPFASRPSASRPCAPTQGAHASAAPTRVQDIAQLLAEYDKHFYYPLGKLLQQLPGDITNLPRLSPEQGQMCLAVSGFAAQAVATIKGGLRALEAMLGKSMACAGSGMPDFQRLLDYLEAESEFMETCQGDYRDAADNVLRAV
jgi:hypothetical protein